MSAAYAPRSSTRPDVNSEVTPVEARRVNPAGGAATSLDADLVRLRQFAKLMDTQFNIAGIPVGLDSIIGLIPAAGDVVSAALNLYPIVLARKHRLPKRCVARMLGNVGLDMAIGVVPVVGDVGDVFFKAAKKNVALFEKYAARIPRE